MALGTTKYILRFGPEGKKDMLIKFRNDETLRENLARIIPNAIRQGLLPESCSADHVEIDYKERTLNLNLPVNEQNLNEYDVLVLRDLSCSVKISMRIKPDKSEPIVQSVTVEPNTVLKEALKDFIGGLSKKHKFYGRRVKRYDLLLGDRKLDLDRTPRSQGIKNDISVTFKPRIRFEWPPGLFWPPGPYTTYLMVIVAVALVVTVILAYRHLWHDEIYVTLKSEWPCKFYDWDGEYLGEKEAQARLLKVGRPYVFTVYPREFPIYEETVHFKERSRDDRLTIEVNPESKFKEYGKANVKIQGFKHNDPGKRLPQGVGVLVNQFPYRTNAFVETDLQLVQGKYEIQYNLPAEDFREVNFSGHVRTRRDFIFDLRDSAFIEEGFVAFKYVVRE